MRVSNNQLKRNLWQNWLKQSLSLLTQQKKISKHIISKLSTAQIEAIAQWTTYKCLEHRIDPDGGDQRTDS